MSDGAEIVATEVLALLTSNKAAPVVVNGRQRNTIVLAADVRAAVRRGLQAANHEAESSYEEGRIGGPG